MCALVPQARAVLALVEGSTAEWAAQAAAGSLPTSLSRQVDERRLILLILLPLPPIRTLTLALTLLYRQVVEGRIALSELLAPLLTSFEDLFLHVRAAISSVLGVGPDGLPPDLRDDGRL